MFSTVVGILAMASMLVINTNAFQTPTPSLSHTVRSRKENQYPTVLFSSSSNDDNADNVSSSSSKLSTPLYHHHTAIRTRNIENAIKFYSLFGYDIEHKFRAGPARAAWLANSMSDKKGQSSAASRLEVIEIPPHILEEEEGTTNRALDLLQNEHLLGLNHYALDVTPYILSLNKDEYYGLDQFLEDINEKSKQMFGKTLRVAMDPKQQVIGDQVFELCFLYDADGCAMELVRYIKDLDQSVQSGWEPWDGSGFVGAAPTE